MGPNSDFKQWKRNFLTFLSLKPAYIIPQLAIRESSVWLDEQAQHYAYALLLHAAGENKHADQAVKCVLAARPDCAKLPRILCVKGWIAGASPDLSPCWTTGQPHVEATPLPVLDRLRPLHEANV
jgi:hypothetical protein